MPALSGRYKPCESVGAVVTDATASLAKSHPLHESRSYNVSYESRCHSARQVQGRPLSSFRDRDLSLNEAQPSVLGPERREPDAHSDTQKMIRTISAPRTVYAKFDGPQSNSDSQPEQYSDRTTTAANSSVALIDLSESCMSEDPQDPARPLKVQFEDSRNQVTTYIPSPTASPIAERVACQDQGSGQRVMKPSSLWDVSAEANPHVPLEDNGEHGGGISRCASNLGSRAGTFNELMANMSGSKPTQRQLLISGNGAEGVNIPDMDPQASRCASNMSTRAGTFDEITADQIVAHPISLVDSILDSTSMLSCASLGCQQPSRCPPTRRVSNMMSCAGTFEEVLDSSEIAVDNELFDGTISRRATNMHTAAGAFEELVDEDGDELGPEEDSCSSMASGVDMDGVNISLSGMVSGMDVAQDTAAEAARAPLISLQNDVQAPPEAHSYQGGWERVMHFAPPGLVEEAHSTSEILYGVLPSDEVEEINEHAGRNPMSTIDANNFQAHGDGPTNMLDNAPHHTGSWIPTRDDKAFNSQSQHEPDLKMIESSRSDRLAVIQEQIKSLTIEEQRHLFCALSVQLKTASDQPAETMSLTPHLSIHTPRRTLKQFQLDEEAEEQLYGPVTSTSLQLQKTASSAGMTVRTPRAKYNVVFAGNENSALPSAMAAIEAKQDADSRAVLTPMEWSMKLAHKPGSGSSCGALPGPLSTNGLHVKMMPPSYPRPGEHTTRLGAYRP